MSVHRLDNIPGFSIDRVAAAVGNDPDVLRLENLDTDLPPPSEAIAATRNALDRDEANSYLPFTGTATLRAAVVERLRRQTGHQYNPDGEVVITCGATEGMLDVLLATTDPGDEVILTDPTYAGMIYRVRLAGATPRLVPFVASGNEWRLDLEALSSSITPRTRAMFLMNPSMPSGAVLNTSEWSTIADLCQKHKLWLIYNAAMERILYDGRAFFHPATLPGMVDRTIALGSVSKEYRMIGWRIGWVVGPATIMSDIARVHIYNVVTPTGIAQAGAEAAVKTKEDGFERCLGIWQRRRDTVLEQMSGLQVIPPAGGWSMLLNVRELGYDSFTASRLLLEKGKVAATPMKDWGNVNSDQFVRIVFSNETVQRFSTLRSRIDRALGHP